MANELFVDTSGFYAALCERDKAHEKAAELLTKGRRRNRFAVIGDKCTMQCGGSRLSNSRRRNKLRRGIEIERTPQGMIQLPQGCEAISAPTLRPPNRSDGL